MTNFSGQNMNTICTCGMMCGMCFATLFCQSVKDQEVLPRDQTRLIAKAQSLLTGPFSFVLAFNSVLIQTWLVLLC